MAPVRARHISPPLVTVAQIDRSARLLKYHRSGYKQFGLCTGIIRGIWRPLSRCHMLGCFDKLAKLFIGDCMCVDPKAVYGYLVRRCFLRVVFVGSHEESATRNTDHFLNSRLNWRL